MEKENEGIESNKDVSSPALGDLFSKLGDKIPMGEGTVITAGDGSEGTIIKGEEGVTETPEQISARADKELKEKQAREKAGKGQKSEKEVAKELADLTAKAKKDIDSLTDEEVEKLVKAGVLTDDSGESKGEQTDEEKADEKKFKELTAKKESELTDEEKEFIEKHKEETEPPLIEKVKASLIGEDTELLKGEYTNDDAGLTKLVDDIAQIRSTKYLQGLVDADPRLKKVMEHFVVQKRGLDTFLKVNTTPEFKSIKLEKVSEANDKAKNDIILAAQRQVITSQLSKKGVDPESIKIIVNAHEDGGKLYEKAVEAYKTLETEDKLDKENALKVEEQEKIAEQTRRVGVINQVKSVITKNDFNGFKIPKDELPSFIKAVTEPINDEGLTRMDVLRNQRLSMERELLFDYLLFKDMKVPGFQNLSKEKRSLVFTDAKKTGGKRAVKLVNEAIGDQTPPNFKLSDFNMAGVKFK